MARNRREPEEEGTGYSWMDTYGDMVTLLLCFFVLLYSFSSIDAEKWQVLVGAFTGSSSATAVEAFDTETVKASAIPTIEGATEKSQDDGEDEREANNVAADANEEAFDRLYQNIRDYIETNSLTGQLSVTKNGDILLLRFVEVVLFESGKADILETGKIPMDHIIEIIGENIDVVSMIRIEGHTDNVPIHNAEFNDNWDLSVQRAINTLQYFINSNVIDNNKLSAVGYGEYQPVDTNDTADGRTNNRRVDFVIEKTED